MVRILSTLPLLFLALACAQAPDAPPSVPAPRAVTTAAAEVYREPEIVFGAGRLAQREETRLSFKTGGIIERIRVREGERVRAGQALAELEPVEVEAQASRSRLGQERMRIELQNAQLALQLAERDLRNVKGLYADSVATLEQLENAETKWKNARNQVKAAETGLALQREQVAVTEYNLRKAAIVAPADGVILRRLAEPNEQVGPGQPVLLLGRRDKAMVLRVHVADRDIVNIRLGDSARVWVDPYPDTPLPGIVRERAGTADPLTGTYELEIEVDPQGRELLAGFIGSVHILGSARPGLLRVPLDALLDADGKTGRVFRLDDGKALRQRVTIVGIRDQALIVSEGLDSSDRVIVSGVSYLEEGMPVRDASAQPLSVAQ